MVPIRTGYYARKFALPGMTECWGLRCGSLMFEFFS